ncbi:DUF2752 domain-containing protein [Riemerella anatipestifer]|uniref:DUF2752 domain-containing protein n=1 Tax=Riemerella anatipestifer TaxID=34085 RepID=A0AAP3AL18_RIEAN|nr:DUF2752 domain-containing protein [Riemerella anatipestifer]AZZ58253.1 DUF2752 domain-containing protein [Riemerella anatipestifer]MBT0549641.1 DUF2752 domain-containing protein [Riemerella anatipestifer]MBT0550486.1 DUF2752 domain-containing protein [Riemerella anatipestifer]MBT0553403.1 DUF2752 domain-containing protein [Riemerella anatipestifer]MBT0556425.1 DUF2752 domain-containing protein [Riemerella anatipestifer]
MAIEDYMLSCPNKKIFGMECFGCGSQRALLLISEGKFVEAFYMFPAIYPLILFVLVSAINFIDKKRHYGKVMIFLALVSVITMIISYFCKNF